MAESASSQTGASEALLHVGQRVGNYRVVRPLGQGGMGAVFEALHQYIERRAAIKVLHPDLSQNPQFASRFLNEARAVNLIQHSGLVEIFEFGMLENGTAYIIMEFLAGESLAQRNRRTRGTGNRDAFFICRQIAQAMSAVHAKDIVHRDLKPDNVMVLADSTQPHGVRTKILDFGIAKLASGSDGKVRTETGAMIGTPAYMSPEQCIGAGTVDGKADVYALGVMLYEMLAYRLPFECEHSFDFMAAHVRDPPRPLHAVLPDVPPEIEDLVHSMLAKKPAERPSMEAVVGLVDQVQALAPELWAKPAASESDEASPARLAFEATVSGEGQGPLLSGKVSDGAKSSGRRTGKEQLELGETVPGVKSMERRISREAVVPLPSAAVPVESQSRESLAPASALSRPEPSRLVNQRRFITILGGLLCVALLAFALARRGGNTAPSAGGIEAARPIRMVRWNVISTPPGAEVRSEGKFLGNTPWEIERPAGPGETALTLSYDGYQDKTIVLSHSTEVKTEVRLAPRVAAAATAAAQVPPAGDSALATAHKPIKNKGGKSHKSRPADGDVKLLID